VQGTAASRYTLPIHSRSRPKTGRVRPVGLARQSALCAPSRTGSLSTQITNPPRDVICPVVPTARYPQRVANTRVRIQGDGPHVGKGTRTAPSTETTDGARVFRTIKNTLPPSVEPTPVGLLPKPLISNPTRRSGQTQSDGPATAGVKLQTPSQASHNRAIAFRSSQLEQGKAVLGGRTIAKALVVNALSTPSEIRGMKNPGPVLEDVPSPHSDIVAVPMWASPISCHFEPAMTRESPIQATSPERVPQDVNHPCTDDTPLLLPSTRREMVLTPSRDSYKANPLHRAPRRPRHIPKRRECTNQRRDSICIDTIPSSCNTSVNHSNIHSTPEASCIQREFLFTPLSHDDTKRVQRDVGDVVYRLRRLPKRPRRAPVRTNRDYARVDATPLARDVNASAADAPAAAIVALPHATSSPKAAHAPCVTLYAGCELRRVLEGLTDLQLDPAMLVI